jgi:hypothetical protein
MYFGEDIKYCGCYIGNGRVRVLCIRLCCVCLVLDFQVGDDAVKLAIVFGDLELWTLRWI